MRYDCANAIKASQFVSINRFSVGWGEVENRKRARISRRARESQFLTSASGAPTGARTPMTDSRRQRRRRAIMCATHFMVG